MSEDNENQYELQKLIEVEREKTTHEKFMDLMVKINASVDDLIERRKRQNDSSA